MDFDAVCSILEQGDEAERLQTVSEIADTEQDSAIWKELVLHLPSEESQAVREAIVFALKHTSCRDLWPELFALFHEDDAYLRNAAMEIFGSGDDQTVAFLAEQMFTADREVRKLILDSLVQIETPCAAQCIRTGLYDPAANVRITAADYLGRLNDTESVDTMLEMFVNDKEPMLRTSILSSVTSMQAPGVVEKLIQFQKIVGLNEEDETLFLPILLRFAGRTGHTDYLAGLLARIRSMPLYAEDVVQAFQNIARSSMEESPRQIVLLEALRMIAQDLEIREYLRFSALTTLTRLEKPLEVPDLDAFVESFSEEDFRGEIAGYCVTR